MMKTNKYSKPFVCVYDANEIMTLNDSAEANDFVSDPYLDAWWRD